MEIVIPIIAAIAGVAAGAGGIFAYNKRNENGGKEKADDLVRKAKREASDIVLITDDLTSLPRCIQTARKTCAIVKQNIVFSIVTKLIFMALGAIGVLPLALAVFADVGVMLLAVLNSLRTKKE